MFKEKREFERKELNVEVRCSVLHPSYESGLARNISQSGICISIDRNLKKESILRLEFTLPGENPEYIEVLGKVVWQKKEDDKFLTGIKFLI